MKKMLLGLLILTALGLILGACLNPSSAGVEDAVVARSVVLKDADKAAALTIAPKVSGRTNASGKDISSGAQETGFPDIYFFWDPKQKDNGYLKVDFFMFDKYESFVLTTKEANKYWDFLIQPVKGQEVTEDGFYVFFIGKQEKNINGVYISDFVDKVLFGPPAEQSYFSYTELVGDIPNPDRGFYRANDSTQVPRTGSSNGSNPTGANGSTVTVGGASSSTRVAQIQFDLRQYSENMFSASITPTFNAAYVTNNGFPATLEGTAAAWELWKATVPPSIAKYTSQPITDIGLTYIRNTLQRIRDGQATCIIRFTYDGGGSSWRETTVNRLYIDECIWSVEPPKEVLLGHIAQLKPILHEYEDIIMSLDGGFFGPWGEMHSSNFGTSPEAYAWLLDGLLDAVPESRSIAVHLGAFLSWYNWKYGTDYGFDNVDTLAAPLPGTPESRFGFFNDSYAYGEDEGDNYPNDWGSLSEGASYLAAYLGRGDEYDYDRGRTMNWIRKQNNLYGGEAQGGRTLWNTYPFVAWEASVAQTVYLNSDYSSSVHNRWRDFTYNEANVTAPMTNTYPVEGYPELITQAIFDPVYNGRTGAEYWRDRLGFRLVVREAAASEWVLPRIGILNFFGKIQNVGFGNIVNKKNVYVILKSAAGTFTALTDLDARLWRPDLDSRATNTDAWRDFSFSVKMSDFGTVPPGDYEIYLKIQDPLEQSANKRCIRFANNGTNIWDANLGANLIGKTTVTE